MSRRYMVVDVFTADVTRGNPVAVVLDAGASMRGDAAYRALDQPVRDHLRPAARR